jgi:hypothetical protein
MRNNLPRPMLKAKLGKAFRMHKSGCFPLEDEDEKRSNL